MDEKKTDEFTGNDRREFIGGLFNEANLSTLMA